MLLRTLILPLLSATSTPPASRPAAAIPTPPASQSADRATGFRPDTFREEFEGPISTDRPDFTETVSVVPRGRVQLEGGYTFTYDREKRGRARDHTFPEFLLRTGVARNFEFRLGWEGLSLTEDVFRAATDSGRRRDFHEHDDGGTDMNIGGKTNLIRQDGLVPDFSVIGQLWLPAGSAGKSSADVDPEVKFLWAYDLSDRFSLAGSVNAAANSDEQGRFLAPSASVSLGYAPADWIGTYVEYIGLFRPERGAESAHTLNGGFTFPITDHFQIDLRAGVGLNGEADDFFSGIGFAFRF